jgi:exodeoxyribonuclease V alpha subunit
MITLQGQLERITYQHNITHYTIGKVRMDDGHRLVTVVGHMAGIQPGDSLRIEGVWETHDKYGDQLKISSFEVLPEDPLESVRKFLYSGFIKGVGPIMARKLLSHFDAELLDVMDTAPERLSEVSGIGKTKAAEIAGAWREHHGTRRAMLFLQAQGIKPFHCGKIINALGPEVVDIIREDPYRVYTDIDEIDFFLADQLAQKLGIAQDDLRRTQACLLYLLDQAVAQGDTFVYKKVLMEKCAGITHGEENEIQAALDTLSASRMVVEDRDDDLSDTVYLVPLHTAEKEIAHRICALLSVPVPSVGIEPEQIASEVVRKLAVEPSAVQLSVLENIMIYRSVIITGGPGTGKTTLIRSICAVFKTLGKRVCLAAPTGRAARRLSEVTRRKASTIHKLLGYHLGESRFEKDRDNPLEADVVIVDEASMVDVMLMFHLIQAVPMNAIFVLVGDVFQLPPVGPGNVLGDLIASGSVPAFELTEIFRQAQESPIVVNAHRVRAGKMPNLNASNLEDVQSEFYFLEQKTTSGVLNTIKDLCTNILPRRFHLDPIRDIQVLSPMHKGEVGIINLNQMLQEALNPRHKKGRQNSRGFLVGDKVMHLKNNYQKEVFNGDIGLVSAVDSDEEELLVDYEGREIIYGFDELDELSLAYAISVHKSQGSEYPAVIVPLITRQYVMLQRNLLYTAMTRGRRLVIIVGMPRAVEIALKNDKPRQRLSGLAQRLNE